MSTKVDPLAETLVVDVTAFDPHAAMTVMQRVDFQAQTRELTVVNEEEPETAAATTFWVPPASIRATEVVAQAAQAGPASPVAPRPRIRLRRGLLTALGVIVAALIVGAVVRARAGQAHAPGGRSQSQASGAIASPTVQAAEAPPRSPSPARTDAVAAPVSLTAEQVQALEASAASALFAADEATARTHYRLLAAAGHEPAQRVLTLLERSP